jgi:hypothetical protein
MFKLLTAASVILALLFSAVPVSADDHRHRRDRDHDYYAPNWSYRSPGHEYRRYDYDWRRTYYEDSYEEYRGPLSMHDLILQLNIQGFYWVYNIRPSHRHTYVTAYAYDRRYGGRSVYLRVNKYTGNVFYFRYN